MQIIQQLLDQGVPPEQIVQQLQAMGAPPEILAQVEQMLAQSGGTGGEGEGAPAPEGGQAAAAPTGKGGGTQSALQEILSRLSSLEGSQSMLVNIIQSVMGGAGAAAAAPAGIPAASMDAGASLMPQAASGKTREQRVNSMILDLLGNK